jgi:hypothetical protein
MTKTSKTLRLKIVVELDVTPTEIEEGQEACKVSKSSVRKHAVKAVRRALEAVDENGFVFIGEKHDPSKTGRFSVAMFKAKTKRVSIAKPDDLP